MWEVTHSTEGQADYNTFDKLLQYKHPLWTQVRESSAGKVTFDGFGVGPEIYIRETNGILGKKFLSRFTDDDAKFAMTRMRLKTHSNPRLNFK
ncbi:MAG: hypothetical protein J4432_02100 [DPANN group archaeon]|nr:hypothetical protein [DPANN group archaeon]